MAMKIPLRQCVGCGKMSSKKEMIRIIKTKEDEIFLDVTGKKNGRGSYICKNIECLNKAIKNKGLERSLKFAIPIEIYDKLKEELVNIENRK